MGAFDKEIQLKNATEFDVTQGCRIWKAEYLGRVSSQKFGENSKARVFATPLNGTEEQAKEYVLFGVQADQIGRQDSNDFPANVKQIEDNQAKVLVRI